MCIPGGVCAGVSGRESLGEMGGSTDSLAGAEPSVPQIRHMASDDADAPVDATHDPSARPFVRIRALVEADRDIRLQLKELRSAIRTAPVGGHSARGQTSTRLGLLRSFSSGGRRARAAAAAATGEQLAATAEEGVCLRMVRSTTGPVLHPRRALPLGVEHVHGAAHLLLRRRHPARARL